MRYRYSVLMGASPLSGWENFYVIVGSSAGALIGLQFVVITLIADLPIGRGAEQAGEAFATPTIVHFGTVLLLSAILNAPWHGIHAAALCWGITGIAGLIYAAIILRRVRRQTAYQPEFEDWLFHLLLPIAAYAMLTGSAGAATSDPRSALFVVAAASLLLLFIGIHNAWDAVTYHVFVQKRKQQEKERERQITASPGSGQQAVSKKIQRSLSVTAGGTTSTSFLRGAVMDGVFSSSLRSSRFEASRQFAARRPVHLRSPQPGGYVYVPSFPIRLEWEGRFQVHPRRRPPAVPM